MVTRMYRIEWREEGRGVEPVRTVSIGIVGPYGYRYIGLIVS